MKLDETLKLYRGIGPGFHFIRHVLSVVIFLAHARYIAASYPAATVATPATAATANSVPESTGSIFASVSFTQPVLFSLVAAFFALSGFLVTGSAVRNADIGTFFANRAFRILPALTVEVSLAALILGPLVTILPISAYLSDPHFFRYFGNIFGFVAFELPGVFTTNPWPNMVNANLWTLPPEFWCYLAMLGLMLAGMLSRPRVLLAVVGIVAAVWTVLDIFDPATFTVKNDATRFTVWYIVLMFFYGAMFSLHANRIKMSAMWFCICAVLYYSSVLFDVLTPLSGIFLTYCVIYLGLMRFTWFDRAVKSDLSYGIYLYGFAIAQTVTHFLMPTIEQMSNTSRFVVIAPISLALTVAFAATSWHFIEKPALSLRKKLSPRPELA